MFFLLLLSISYLLFFLIPFLRNQHTVLFMKVRCLSRYFTFIYIEFYLSFYHQMSHFTAPPAFRTPTLSSLKKVFSLFTAFSSLGLPLDPCRTQLMTSSQCEYSLFTPNFQIQMFYPWEGFPTNPISGWFLWESLIKKLVKCLGNQIQGVSLHSFPCLFFREQQ